MEHEADLGYSAGRSGPTWRGYPRPATLHREFPAPRSAAMLAAAVGLPRQKVNYHLRTLEQHGLVELVEERRKGNVTERLLQAAEPMPWRVYRDPAGHPFCLVVR